jgi:tRNA dimethylallyltransferase
VSVNPVAPPSPSALPLVPVLVGPTASGKTDVSLELARHLNAEIISADSRQIYRYMDIGTAKPTEADRRAVRHYFVDELLPDKEFNAGEFGRRGREIIHDIIRRGKVPLVVGGSGLYIRALVDGFFDGPSADPGLRRELHRLLDEQGPEYLYDMLKAADPAAAGKMLPSNTRRVIRALEVLKITGIPISSLHETKIEIGFTPVFVGLEWERKQLYSRINRRVELMIDAGLEAEVRNLQSMGFTSDMNALMTVGYREMFGYLDGVHSLSETIELIKMNTRRYAKRQLTWFRPDRRIRWYPVGAEMDSATIAMSILRDL